LRKLVENLRLEGSFTLGNLLARRRSARRNLWILWILEYMMIRAPRAPSLKLHFVFRNHHSEFSNRAVDERRNDKGAMISIMNSRILTRFPRATTRERIDDDARLF